MEISKKEIVDLVKRLEMNTNYTETGTTRDLLCDCNIMIRTLAGLAEIPNTREPQPGDIKLPIFLDTDIPEEEMNAGMGYTEAGFVGPNNPYLPENSGRVREVSELSTNSPIQAQNGELSWDKFLDAAKPRLGKLRKGSIVIMSSTPTPNNMLKEMFKNIGNGVHQSTMTAEEFRKQYEGTFETGFEPAYDSNGKLIEVSIVPRKPITNVAGLTLGEYAKKFNKHIPEFIKDPTLCSRCNRPHFLRDEDAGSERDTLNLCDKCYTLGYNK